MLKEFKLNSGERVFIETPQGLIDINLSSDTSANSPGTNITVYTDSIHEIYRIADNAIQIKMSEVKGR